MAEGGLQLALVFAIAIVAVYLWKQEAAHKKPESQHRVKVAMALLVRKPTDLLLWFEHHRKAGISRFYIRLEDSPGTAAYLRTQEDVYFEEGTSDEENNYTGLIERQKIFVNAILPKAKADGMEWIFHVDSDELLEGDVLGTLESMPPDVLIGKLKNAEAVYTDGEPTCFSAKRFIRCDKGGPCTAYVNGKGVGRLVDGVTLGGPHDFVYKGKVDPKVTYQIPFEDLHILHYDSCTLGAWLEKFAHIAKKAKMDDIVFPYYKKSIEVATKAKDLYAETKMREDLNPKWTYERGSST